MRIANDQPPQGNSVSPAHIEERRWTPKPNTPIGYLKQLPGVALLQRLPVPVMAVDRDGTIVFANSACTAMLGYDDGELTGLSLSHVLVTDGATAPASALSTLRAPIGAILNLRHRSDEPVSVTVSDTLLRADDPLVLVKFTEVTDWLWNHSRDGSPPPATRAPVLDDESVASR